MILKLRFWQSGDGKSSHCQNRQNPDIYSGRDWFEKLLGYYVVINLTDDTLDLREFVPRFEDEVILSFMYRFVGLNGNLDPLNAVQIGAFAVEEQLHLIRMDLIQHSFDRFLKPLV
jgi:hypothetical protein